MYKVIICKVILFVFIIFNAIIIIKNNIQKEKSYNEQIIRNVGQFNYISKESYNEAFDLIITNNNNEIFIEHSPENIKKIIFKGKNTKYNINDIINILKVLYDDDKTNEWIKINLNESFDKINEYKIRQEVELKEKDREYILRLSYDEKEQINVYISITIF